MAGLRAFLESSTIHGMSYISAPGRYVRVFWTLVVIAGFTGAGIMIHQSFQSWADSPVTTTIETLPITKITFPKVTVCPPKNTYTDLNYDLLTMDNMTTLTNDSRNELEKFCKKQLYDHLYSKIVEDLSIIDEVDRYHNWYYGYTQILPSLSMEHFYTATNAKSGNLSTQYFGDKFEPDKVKTKLEYNIEIYKPSQK